MLFLKKKQNSGYLQWSDNSTAEAQHGRRGFKQENHSCRIHLLHHSGGNAKNRSGNKCENFKHRHSPFRKLDSRTLHGWPMSGSICHQRHKLLACGWCLDPPVGTGAFGNWCFWPGPACYLKPPALPCFVIRPNVCRVPPTVGALTSGSPHQCCQTAGPSKKAPGDSVIREAACLLP